METAGAVELPEIFTRNVDDPPDCTEKCRSTCHGSLIGAIASKAKGKSDEQILYLWSNICLNYGHVRDEFGRQALHWCASTGLVKAAEWIIKHEKSNINAKDYEGCTPLHKSILFGNLNVARTLIKLGADINIKDHEGLTPLELLKIEKEHLVFSIRADPTDLFIWGSNDNYNLGIDSRQLKTVPVHFERFRHDEQHVCQVELQRYHSVFLSQEGKVYSCGLGRSGRLGFRDEQLVLKPTLIFSEKHKDKCVQIAAGVDHTLFLFEDGKVRSCGSNTNGALGHPNVPLNEIVLRPRVIQSLSNLKTNNIIIGVRASNIHSVFFTPHRIFMCGLNEGQLAIFGDVGSIINQPKPIVIPGLHQIISSESNPKESKIAFTHIECNEAATVIRVDFGELFLLYNYECRRIKNTRQLDIEKICLAGGSLASVINEKRGKGPTELLGMQSDLALCIFILDSTGTIFLWREQTTDKSTSTTMKQELIPGMINSRTAEGSFTRIVYGLGRTLTINDFALSENCLMFITSLGSAYTCPWSCYTQHHSTTTFLNKKGEGKEFSATFGDWQVASFTRRVSRAVGDIHKSNLEYFKAKKIPNIHMAVKAFCDPKGKNFAIIQQHSMLEFIDIVELPSQSFELYQHLKDFYFETTDDDSIHDVIFIVKNNEIPAHRFIIASCPELFKLVSTEHKNNSDILPARVTIKSTQLTPDVFTHLLQYIYFGHCDWSLEESTSQSFQSPIDKVLTAASALQLTSIEHEIKKWKQDPLKMKRPPIRKFDRNSHKSLCDIILKTDTEDKYEVAAHKCMLVARSEYFRHMLSAHNWLEGSSSKPLSLPVNKFALDALLDYIYTDSSTSLSKCTDLDNLFQVLFLGDHLLLKRLTVLAEKAISDIMTLKNIAEVIDMAHDYNGLQLLRSSMSYACLNAASVLENRLIDLLSSKEMSVLNEHYKNIIQLPLQKQRRLSPWYSAPSDEEYFIASDKVRPEFVTLLENIEDDENIQAAKKSRGKSGSIRLPLRVRTTSETDPELVSNVPVQLSSSFENNDHYDNFSPEVLHEYDESFDEPPSKFVTVQRKKNIKIPLPSQTMSLSIKTPPKKNVESTLSTTPVQVTPSPKLNLMEFPSLLSQSPAKTSTNNFTPVSSKAINISPTKSSTINSIPIQTPSPPKTTKSKKKAIKWVSLDSTETSFSTTPSPPKTVVSRTCDGRDPLNPWQLNSPPDAKLSSNGINTNDSNSTFNTIVKEEQDKNDNLQRAITKPLNMMVIEDQAIEELTCRYNTADVEDGYQILTVERVSVTQFAKPRWVSAKKPFWQLFGPSEDSVIIEEGIRENVLRDRIAQYPLLFGVTKTEMLPWMSEQDAVYGLENEKRREILRMFIEKYYNVHRNEILAAAVHEYTDWERPVQHPISVRDETLDALGDAKIVAPLVRLAGLHSQSNPKSYFYVFEYQSKSSDYPQRLGTIHSEELPYVFGAPLFLAEGTSSELRVFTGNFTKQEIQLSQTVLMYFSNFIKTGNPNDEKAEGVVGSGSRANRLSSNEKQAKPKVLEWPPYDPLYKKYLSFDTKIRMRTHYRAHKLSFWLHLVPDLQRNGYGSTTQHHTVSFNPPLSSSSNQNPLLAPPSAPNSGLVILPEEIQNSSTPSPPTRGLTVGGATLWEHNPNSKSSQGNFFQGTGSESNSSESEGFQMYSTALSVTIAIGCSLLILNILIFAAFYYQRDKRRVEENEDCNSPRTHSSTAIPCHGGVVRTQYNSGTLNRRKENGQAIQMQQHPQQHMSRTQQQQQQATNMPNICGDLPLSSTLESDSGPDSSCQLSYGCQQIQLPNPTSQNTSGSYGTLGRGTLRRMTHVSSQSDCCTSPSIIATQQQHQTYDSMSMPDAVVSASMMNVKFENSPEHTTTNCSTLTRSQQKQQQNISGNSGTLRQSSLTTSKQEQQSQYASTLGSTTTTNTSGGSGNTSSGGEMSTIPQYGDQSKSIPRPPKRTTPTVKFCEQGPETSLDSTSSTTNPTTQSGQQTLKPSLKKSLNYSSNSDELRV